MSRYGYYIKSDDNDTDDNSDDDTVPDGKNDTDNDTSVKLLSGREFNDVTTAIMEVDGRETRQGDDDDADENSDHDTTSNTYSSGDISTGVRVTVSLDSVVEDTTTIITTVEVVHDVDDDDDDDDDVQIQQNEANVQEGILVNSSSKTVLESNGSTNGSMIPGNKTTNVTNVNQSTGGDSIITKIWRKVKVVLNAVRNFWFKTTWTE